jgi:hypothetical protein
MTAEDIEAGDCALLVASHQPAIADDICRKAALNVVFGHIERPLSSALRCVVVGALCARSRRRRQRLQTRTTSKRPRSFAQLSGDRLLPTAKPESLAGNGAGRDRQRPNESNHPLGTAQPCSLAPARLGFRSLFQNPRARPSKPHRKPSLRLGAQFEHGHGHPDLFKAVLVVHFIEQILDGDLTFALRLRATPCDFLHA